MRIAIAALILSLCIGLFPSATAFSAPLIQEPPSMGIVNANANLRAGPGTNYAKVGFAPAGTQVGIAACNTGCTWYQLDSGKWIAAWLVDATDGGCDDSYPTLCIPPPPPDLDCADIGIQSFLVVGADPHGFDGDNDGLGCEPPPPGASDPADPPIGDPPPPEPCDPNYAGACIEIVPYDLDCADVVPYKKFQSIGSDPHNLDGDNDGIACEG